MNHNVLSLLHVIYFTSVIGLSKKVLGYSYTMVTLRSLLLWLSKFSSFINTKGTCKKHDTTEQCSG